MKLIKYMGFQQGGGFYAILIFFLAFIPACGGTVPGTAPKVISSSPSDGENTDFPRNRGISVTFSKEMDKTSINEDTFFLSKADDLTPLAGTIATDGITASLKPDNNLESATDYIATVSLGVRDLSGNAIAEVFQFTLKTAPVPSGADPDADLDQEPPAIVSTSPSNGATGVPLNSVITVTFSEAIDPMSITPDTFDLSKGANPAKLFVSGNVAIFEPDLDLRDDTEYTVTMRTGIKDLAENALAVEFVWIFFTVKEEAGDGF